MKTRLSKDSFLTPYYRLVCEIMIPYQWNALNDLIEGAEKSYCIENIKRAAGLSEGGHRGMVFQDSDAAKWLEALACCIANGDAVEWESKADSVIDLISQAQTSDGYFNTYFQLNEPEKRFTNLYEAHELYCLGHFIEAAVAYHKATGKRKALDIFCKYADLVDSIFGRGEGKRQGYPGHQEIELALVKLYETTGEARYLSLARFFIDNRGTEPHFFAAEWKERDGYSIWSKRNEPVPDDFSYNQAHLPVREQTAATGHAVRAVYMYTAMAEIGRLTNDDSLLDACERIFCDILRQLYVTGGIGQTNHGEAFTFAYDLPNDINYSETCASIGLMFFMRSMLKSKRNGKYADVMENALYNTVLASFGTDGKSYFYVNPMEVVPKASANNPAKRHVTAARQKWHACACCPPNAARLLASVNDYLYSENGDTVFINMYAASEAVFELESGTLKFTVQTDYPLSGEIKIIIESAPGTPITIAARAPSFTDKIAVKLTSERSGNDNDINVSCVSAAHESRNLIKDGYITITRVFSPKEAINLSFDMSARIVYANAKIRANAGKACVMRGPLVYCLEEFDNGSDLHLILLDHNAPFTEQPDVIGGIPCITLKTAGFRESPCASDEMYTTKAPSTEECELTFVPYHLWGNRAPGEMIVWCRGDKKMIKA